MLVLSCSRFLIRPDQLCATLSLFWLGEYEFQSLDCYQHCGKKGPVNMAINMISMKLPRRME